jgi:hypothetical protein
MGMTYKQGQRFQLKQHVGYRAPHELHEDAQYEAFLDRHHPIFEGQVGTVVEIVPAEAEGAGNHEEEHVVLLFEARRLVDHNDGDVIHEAIEGHPGRMVSFTQQQMDGWFEPAAGGAIETAPTNGADLPEEKA